MENSTAVGCGYKWNERDEGLMDVLRAPIICLPQKTVTIESMV
jgi:hypothetical protein